MPDPQRSAVQFFTYDHPLLARTLRGKLELVRQKQIDALGENYCIDWPDYKHRTGMIAGLKTAIDICIDEEKKLGD